MDNEDYLERVAILLEGGMAEDQAKQQALLEIRKRDDGSR